MGGWGSIRLKGTLEFEIVLGAPWVGMAHPAATTASVIECGGEQRTSHSRLPLRRTACSVVQLVAELVAQVVLGEHGQREDEPRAAGGRGLHAHVALHRPHVLGHERQAQAGAGTGAPASRGGAAVEALEDLEPLQGVDAGAGVVDRDLDLLCLVPGVTAISVTPPP